MVADEYGIEESKEVLRPGMLHDTTFQPFLACIYLKKNKVEVLRNPLLWHYCSISLV